MTAETPDLRSLAYRLEMLLERVQNLEVQVRGLVESQTIEAEEFESRMSGPRPGPAGDPGVFAPPDLLRSRVSVTAPRRCQIVA